MGAAASAVITAPSSLVALEEQRYQNRVFNFGFEKPREWFYLSYQEYSESGAELEEVDDDVQSLREAMGEPVVTIARYHRTPPAASPSIVVFAEVPTFDVHEETLFDLDMSPFEVLPKFVLEQPPIPDLIDGQIASRTEYSYDFASGGSGDIGRMRTSMYATIYGGAICTFNFTDVLMDPYSSTDALLKARTSVRLA